MYLYIRRLTLTKIMTAVTLSRFLMEKLLWILQAKERTFRITFCYI